MNKRLLLSLFLVISAPVLAEEAQQEVTRSIETVEATEAQNETDASRKKEIADEAPAAAVVAEAVAEENKAA